jgi:hypothetical protein
MSLGGAAVSLGATAISVAFAALVFNHWLTRRKPFQLAWSLGLGLYAFAAFTQFVGEAYGWSEGTYKVYYLLAALLVATLGIGSALLVHRRAGIGFTLYTAVVFIGFVIAILGAPINLATIPDVVRTVPSNVRVYASLLAIPGGIALIGIAAYSYWRTRLAFNAWIAVGAAVVAGGGSLTGLGIPAALYLSELVGIALMFWGFLTSQDLAKARVRAPSQTPS